MIKILIADDHQLFRDGLKSILSEFEELEIMTMAENGVECLRSIKKETPDVVLLDVNMPEKDGIDTAKEIIRDFPTVKIVMLTMVDKHLAIDRLSKLGVDGYMIKNSSSLELRKAIKSVYSGKKYYSPEIVDKLLNNIQKPDSVTFSLTKREVEVLRLISEGYKTNQMAEDLFLSTHTINTHRKNLLSKAGVQNSIDLINWGRDKGYLD